MNSYGVTLLISLSHELDENEGRAFYDCRGAEVVGVAEVEEVEEGAEVAEMAEVAECLIGGFHFLIRFFMATRRGHEISCTCCMDHLSSPRSVLVFP